MPDAAAHKIINVTIDSIQAVSMWKEECNTNIGDARESNTRQEADVSKESYTNMDEDLKVDNNVNGSSNNTNVNTLTNYFSVLQMLRNTKQTSIELTWRIRNIFDNVFNGIGASKAHFLCSSNLIANPIKHH